MKYLTYQKSVLRSKHENNAIFDIHIGEQNMLHSGTKYYGSLFHIIFVNYDPNKKPKSPIWSYLMNSKACFL